MSERTGEHILEALRLALAESGEHRLFRGGKLAGLFSGRAGAAGDAAAEALRDGLLEVVRTETKGKITIDWVRITPRGVEHLHAHESPVAALRELRRELTVAAAGVPRWLDSLDEQWRLFQTRLADQLQETQRRLDALAVRVEEALKRADVLGPALPNGVAATVPWANEALGYIDRRQNTAAGPCPLPELFAALRRAVPTMSLTDFQHGLRRLADHKALRLLPFDGPADKLPEPEYALLHGAEVLYYAGR